MKNFFNSDNVIYIGFPFGHKGHFLWELFLKSKNVFNEYPTESTITNPFYKISKWHRDQTKVDYTSVVVEGERINLYQHDPFWLFYDQDTEYMKQWQQEWNDRFYKKFKDKKLLMKGHQHYVDYNNLFKESKVLLVNSNMNYIDKMVNTLILAFENCMEEYTLKNETDKIVFRKEILDTKSYNRYKNNILERVHHEQQWNKNINRDSIRIHYRNSFITLLENWNSKFKDLKNKNIYCLDIENLISNKDEYLRVCEHLDIIPNLKIYEKYVEIEKQ